MANIVKIEDNSIPQLQKFSWTVKFLKENTLESGRNVENIVQIWGGAFNIMADRFKGRVSHEIKALGTSIIVKGTV